MPGQQFDACHFCLQHCCCRGGSCIKITKVFTWALFKLCTVMEPGPIRIGHQCKWSDTVSLLSPMESRWLWLEDVPKATTKTFSDCPIKTVEVSESKQWHCLWLAIPSLTCSCYCTWGQVIYPWSKSRCFKVSFDMPANWSGSVSRFPSVEWKSLIRMQHASPSKEFSWLLGAYSQLTTPPAIVYSVMMKNLTAGAL